MCLGKFYVVYLRGASNTSFRTSNEFNASATPGPEERSMPRVDLRFSRRGWLVVEWLAHQRFRREDMAPDPRSESSAPSNSNDVAIYSK